MRASFAPATSSAGAAAAAHSDEASGSPAAAAAGSPVAGACESAAELSAEGWLPRHHNQAYTLTRNFLESTSLRALF